MEIHMNDEYNAQLTSEWVIPRYARQALWVEGIGGPVQVEGPHGLFELDAPASEITVRWGAPDGPALARLPWQVDTLEWNGQVRMGGFIDALHLFTLPTRPDPLLLVYSGGQPLKHTLSAFPTERQRSSAAFKPDFHAGLLADLPETSTTWVTSSGGPPADLVQTALVHNLRLYCFGHLAGDDSGYGDHLALPLVLDSVTLFTG
jgi:hypothetical protein